MLSKFIAQMPGFGHLAKEKMAYLMRRIGHLMSLGMVGWLCLRVASTWLPSFIGSLDGDHNAP